MSTTDIDIEGTNEKEIIKIKEKFTKKAFFNLLFVCIVEKFTYFINPFIDNMIVSAYLDSSVQAALGFFVPLITFFTLFWVVIVGVQILCSQYKGNGEKKRAIVLFNTSAIVMTVILTLEALFFIVYRVNIAELLGANTKDVVNELTTYIVGYSISLPAQGLFPLFLWYLNFNGDSAAPRNSLIIMIFANSFLDYMFVVEYAMRSDGLALATSIGYILSFAYVFVKFALKYGREHISILRLSFTELFNAIKIGRPALFFNAGITIKGLLLNFLLMDNIGTAAIQVMSIQGIIAGIIGAIPAGHADDFGSLGSAYYGAKDRVQFIYSAKIAIKNSLIISTIMAVIFMGSSAMLTDLFFLPWEDAWEICQHMFIIYPIFGLFNTVLSVLIKAYNLKEEYLKHNKDAWIVDGCGLYENILVVVFGFFLIKIMDSDGIWFSFIVTDLFLIILIGFSVFRDAGNKFTYKFSDWIKVNPNFGTAYVFEGYCNSIEKTSALTKDSIKFFDKYHVSGELLDQASIVVKEMLTKIAIPNQTKKKKSSSYIRIKFRREIDMNCDNEDLGIKWHEGSDSYLGSKNIPEKMSALGQMLSDKILAEGEEKIDQFVLKYLAEVKITSKYAIEIRIVDDNKASDIEKLVKDSGKDDVLSEKRNSLNLIKKIAERYGRFDYQNIAGINNTMIILRPR